MPASKPDIRMLLHEDVSTGGARELFAVSFTAIYAAENGEWHSPMWHSFSEDGVPKHLDGVEVHALARLEEEPARFFGYERVEYCIRTRASVEQVAEAARTLKAVEKKIGQQRDRYGYAQDLAAHMAYVGVSVGCHPTEPFIRHSREHGYQLMNVNGLRYRLQHLVGKARKDRGVAVA